MKKILFIGGGKMMQAIAGGLLARGMAATSLAAVEPEAAAAGALHQLGIEVFLDGVSAAPRLNEFGTLVLAVKPQVLREALTPFAGHLSGQLVISIAAGVRTVDLARWLGAAASSEPTQIVRAMPNTPALIQAGITGLFAGAGVSQISRDKAESLLAAVGKTTWFNEEAMLDAVTAVSGSGPAYVFYFIEALETAALELGFTAPAARQFALETFRGAALLAATSADAPATLRANVTSRKGTTAAAIAEFDRAALKSHFVDGVHAAASRATELGDELSVEPVC